MSRRFVLRSDNLRAPPRWITPELVGRLIGLSMPAGSRTAPIVQVATRGVKPKLAIIPNSNPPLAHSRRSEESEAAVNGPTPAASPRRKSTPTAGTTRPAATPVTAAESGPALHPVERDRLAHMNGIRAAEAAARIEAERPLFQIAFDRGIAIVDLAHALGKPQATVLHYTRRAGFRFGKRSPLADPLTRERLLALADPAAPLPELRCDRLKRERVAKWTKYSRDKRAPDVARRRAERLVAAEQRRVEALAAKEERGRQRELERARKRIAKLQPKPKPIREVEKAAVCRPVNPAPSREPAAPSPPAPRAQPVVVRPTVGAARYLNYAEKMNAAVAFLRGRGFVVQRHDRESVIARWHISGWTGQFDNEQLIQLAVYHGLEVQA